MVGRPSDDGGEDDALIGEGAVGVVTDGIAEVVGVAGAVGEVVFAVVLVYPGGFEEAVGVVGLEGFAVFVNDEDGAWLFGKFEHVVAQTGYAGGECGFVAFGQIGTFEGFVVLVALELSAPDAAEVEVLLAVVVFQDGYVDGVAAHHGCGLRDEGAFGAVGYGDAEAEDVVAVFQGEVHVILAIFLLHVAIPQLATMPGDVLDAEYDAVVGEFLFATDDGFEVVGGEDVVVFHVEVVAVVVFGYATFPVMAGVNVQTAIPYVYGGVGHVVLRDEIGLFHCGLLVQPPPNFPL